MSDIGSVASGGRSGVGIRLYTEGGAVVKRTFDQVGDAGQRMWTQIAIGEKSANPALRAVSRASNEAQEGIAGLGARAGAAGNILSAFGAAGVGVAAVLGAIVLSAHQAKQAMDFADELDDSANKLNIGVEALQEYRFAMEEVGGTADDADRAIDGFQKKLGEALAGGRSVKWFEALGFDREGLRTFNSTEDAMAAVIDKIAALGTEAERAAVAEKLGLGPMVPLIREGTASIEAMRAEARELGLVMDEQMVKRGAEAAREFEKLSQVVDLQLKAAFIDLAPVLVDLLGIVARLATAFNNLSQNWKTFEQRTDERLRQDYDRLEKRVEFAQRQARAQPGGRLTAVQQGWADDLADIEREIGRRAREASMSGNLPDGGGLLELPDRPARAARGGGRGDAARDAERRAREQERALEALNREEISAQRDWIQSRYGPGGPLENRHDLALALATEEKKEHEAQLQALRKQLEDAGALDAIAEARLEELRIVQEQIAVSKDAAILLEERRALAAERLKAETARDEDAIDLLSIDQELAVSARERLEIARRILILQQDLELKLLEATADEDGSRSADEQAAIERTVNRHGRELELFDHNAREDLREQFKSYGREVVDAIEDGRIGEHIADEMKARLIDMALNGLFDFLNPKGGGGLFSGLGSFVGSLFAGKGPGRAGGGDLWPGYRHPVAETARPELLLIGGQGQVTGAAETARLLREVFEGGGGANGGRTEVHQHTHKWDLRGAVVTEDLLRQMDERARAAENSAVRRAGDQARRSLGGMSERLADLGTV